MKLDHRIVTFCLIAFPLAALAAEPQAAGAKQPAGAQGPIAADPPPMFQQLDANHDGYISRDEAKRSADVSARFVKLDTNHDGKVSVEEFIKGTQQKP